MSVQKYPYDVRVFKGENRILVIPIINHKGGFGVASDWYNIITDVQDYLKIGEGILSAMEIIETSPLSTKGEKERDTWKKGSKYRSYRLFTMNNNSTAVKKHSNGDYEIYSTKKGLKYGGYFGSIKKLYLSSTANAEDLGKAVLDVLEAAEDFYANADCE